MSNEISMSVSLTFNKGGASVSRVVSGQVDVTGDALTHEVQEIGTSEEALAEGADLGTPGLVYIKNLDATNYVEVGITGQYSIKLKAGEFAIYRAAAAQYAKANTAACKVEYIIIED